MNILNHILMRSKEKERSARFPGELLNIDIAGPEGPFIPVKISDDTMIEFDDRNEFVEGHSTFLVDDAVFDHVLHKIYEKTFLVDRQRLDGIIRLATRMIDDELSMHWIQMEIPMSFSHQHPLHRTIQRESE